MSKKLNVLYGTQAPVDANNPDGAFKNDGTPGDKTGTPLEKEWQNDIYGFLTRLLDQAGITRDGSQENINNSQYFAALEALFYRFGNDLDFDGKFLIACQTILDQQVGPGAFFNGSNSFFEIPDNTNLNFGVNDFSIFGVFKTDHDYTSAAGQIVNKRVGSGDGYQVFIGTNNKLVVIIDESTSVQIESDNVVNDGKYHVFVILCDRNGNLSMYLDGKAQQDTAAMSGNTVTNVRTLSIGYDEGSSIEYFKGIISEIRLYNYLIDTTDAKIITANRQLPIDYTDEYGSNVVQNVSTITNSGIFPYDTFSGASASGFSAAKTLTANEERASTGDEIKFVKGKSYLVSFDLVLNSGTPPDIRGRSFESGGTLTNRETSANGSNKIILIAESTDTGLVQFVSAAADLSNFVVSNLEVTQLGVTLHLPGSNLIAGTKDPTTGQYPADFWKDNSGNGNNAVGSDVLLTNYRLQDQEIENTFIASLACGTSGTITLLGTQDTLLVYKKGRKVSISGQITVTSVSSPLGQLYLEGLPYSCDTKSELTDRAILNISFTNLNTAKTDDVIAYIFDGESKITISDGANGTGGLTNDFADHIKAGTTLRISGFYYTND